MFQYSIKGMMLVITLGCFCLAAQERFADALFKPRVTDRQLHQVTEMIKNNSGDMEAVCAYEHISHESLLDRWDRGMAYVGFFCVFQMAILILAGIKNWKQPRIDYVTFIGFVVLFVGLLKLLC